MRGYLLIGFALLALAPQQVSGQVLISALFADKVTTENFHLSIVGGANLADLSGASSSDGEFGACFGLAGEWRFADPWYLQFELLPFYGTGAKGLPLGSLGVAPPEDLVTDEVLSRSTSYFAIPLMVKYVTLEDRLLFGFGGQVGFLQSAADRYEASGIEHAADIKLEADVSGELESTDYGLLFQLEYRPDGYFGSSIAVRYYMGMADVIADNSGDEVTNSVFSLLVTAPIGDDPSAAEAVEEP